MCSIERDDSSPYTRTQMRSLTFHMLYALDTYNYENSVAYVIDNINRGYEQDIPMDGEIAQTVESIVERRDYLDEIIQKFLENWRLSRLGLCTRLILRMGVWELVFTDAPSSVIINESIELAKDFAEKDAYKFINGILDQVAEKREDLKRERSTF
ncbi:TPA: transcription antitermination factor NusB [Candidatus Dependentiae bacterium]|nr:MAG: N utilization substance protein B-like protein [candidate division TM6 bacterium GW2011_GWF2_36_131]KKQ03690.1 MAG: N utilization substance protein B-like protein [candidate division TM6 bacterium GW2011_GWE2_36_25]KKQ20074.1 MAG: N utilization substance protein B-like protein [candidate division TM6 bacterium GW2011_GWA2_36_9]HBR70457.1 transcription antitermination factor NusB [Candidatus Dependentiae bacterium]HCU00827.1 transcription antitermination factor NusB [Candidatus Dependent